MHVCVCQVSIFLKIFFNFNTINTLSITLHMDERNGEFWREVYKIFRQSRVSQAGNDIFQVSTWPEKYGCDGIDLDLEEGAGAKYVYFSEIFSSKLATFHPSYKIRFPRHVKIFLDAQCVIFLWC